MPNERASRSESMKAALDALRFAVTVAEGEEWNFGESLIPAGDKHESNGLKAYRGMLGAVVALEHALSETTFIRDLEEAIALLREARPTIAWYGPGGTQRTEKLISRVDRFLATHSER